MSAHVYPSGTILTTDGARGTFREIRLQNGRSEPSVEVSFKGKPPIVVPARLLVHKRGKTFTLPLRLAEISQADKIAAVIPLVAESLKVSKREVVTGGVRISKKVYQDTQTIDEPLFKEDVEIERIPVNRFVEAPQPIRKDGETMIVPLYEEAIVVEKRLLLREQLVIRKRRTEFHTPKKVTRRREDIVIRELDRRGKLVKSKK